MHLWYFLIQGPITVKKSFSFVVNFLSRRLLSIFNVHAYGYVGRIFHRDWFFLISWYFFCHSFPEIKFFNHFQQFLIVFIENNFVHERKNTSNWLFVRKTSELDQIATCYISRIIYFTLRHVYVSIGGTH